MKRSVFESPKGRAFARAMQNPAMRARMAQLAHEAGHAVVAGALAFDVRRIRAQPGGRATTMVRLPATCVTDTEIGFLVAFYVAGFCAERWFGGIPREIALAHAEDDLRHVAALWGEGDAPSPHARAIRRHFREQSTWRLFTNNWFRMSRWLVEENGGVLLDVVDAMAIHPVLEGKALRALLAPVTFDGAFARLRALIRARAWKRRPVGSPFPPE